MDAGRREAGRDDVWLRMLPNVESLEVACVGHANLDHPPVEREERADGGLGGVEGVATRLEHRVLELQLLKRRGHDVVEAAAAEAAAEAAAKAEDVAARGGGGSGRSGGGEAGVARDDDERGQVGDRKLL